jgi:uncharacterized protein YjbI with pentapeptide repeats
MMSGQDSVGQMRVAINIYFTAAPSGGMPKLVELLRDVGAARIGSTDVVRAPIELAEPAMLQFADEVRVAGDTWTGSITAGPVWSIAIRWPHGVIDAASQVLARLVAVGSVDFAVCHALADDADVSNDLDAYRDEVVCFLPAVGYQQFGPPGLGTSTYLGARVLSLLDEPARDVLANHGTSTGDLLHLATSGDDGKRRALQETFVASGVVQVILAIHEVTAGPRWVPLPDGNEPLPYKGKSAKVIDKLQSVRLADGDDPVTDIKCSKLVAPFARLPSTHAENLDIEHGKLPFAELAGARVHDARCGGVDLRGVDARGSQWIDVGLVEADLQWATFAASRLSFSVLDNANCAHIDLTDAAELESATGACFDDATAPRWSAKDAMLTGASFRAADLRSASFEGANLAHARFDGADLRGASFRDADLTGATFTGANMTGADINGAKTDGAIFDSWDDA